MSIRHVYTLILIFGDVGVKNHDASVQREMFQAHYEYQI